MKVSQPPAVIAAATHTPAVSATAPTASAPRYGLPTSTTADAPTPTTSAPAVLRDTLGQPAGQQQHPGDEDAQPDGAHAGVPATLQRGVAGHAVELQPRPGQQVDADHAGGDGGDHAQRPERAAGPGSRTTES